MEITGDIYAQTQEEFDKAVAVARRRGYTFKEMSDFKSDEPNGRGLFLSLGDKVFQRKAKCGFCGHLNSHIGCKAHGKTCDSCDKVIHYDLLKGDLIKFVFRKDEQQRQITLRVHNYNHYHSLLLCEMAIPKKQLDTWHNIKTRKDVLAVMEEFSTEYKIVERDGKKYYAFYKSHGFALNEFDVINTHETRSSEGRGPAGRTHNRVVKLYKGEEYDDLTSSFRGIFEGTFPVPESFHIYRDWLVEKNVHEFCSRSGMSSRPEYYSGRGINRGDLNEENLKKMHEYALLWYGEDAASSFIEMVKGTKEMNATAFLKRVHTWFNNDFTWDSVLDDDQSESDGIELNKSSVAQQFATLTHVMTGGRMSGKLANIVNGIVDDSIKTNFLNSIKS